jgi:hypothetical protein
MEKPMSQTIPAEVHSDDHKVTATFDALQYFSQASDDDLVALVDCGFGGDYPADEVAQFMAEFDEGVARVFTYLSFEPEHFGEKVGFECHVDQSPALRWIKSNRPTAYQRLLDEDLIDPIADEPPEAGQDQGQTPA